MSITTELRERIDDEALLLSTRRELWNIADRIDAELAERYVELPVDADGVPIRVGDEMVYPNLSGHPVRFITLNENGWGVNERNWVPSMLFHRRPLTVEDVLQKFALACEDAGNAGPEVAHIAAEYAAKLRLAGDGE